MARIPRPILMAPAGILQGKPPSVSEQVATYLKRLRHTIPFPVTPEQIYFGCMPEVIYRMHAEGLFNGQNKPTGKVKNLLSCLTRAEVRSMEVSPNIVHVTVNQPVADVFWFEVLQGLPSPLYRLAEAFTLPEDHPHREALLAWVRQCASIEQGIQKVLATVLLIEGACLQNGPAWKAVWPDIDNFVKLKRGKEGIPRQQVKNLLEKINYEVKRSDMELATDLLATCVLLPAKAARLQGWINFHSEEYANE